MRFAKQRRPKGECRCRQAPALRIYGSRWSRAARHPSADENLLFGILALQLDFISRDQLVEAMNAWVLAKHKPLGDILREQDALAAEQHAAS